MKAITNFILRKLDLKSFRLYLQIGCKWSDEIRPTVHYRFKPVGKLLKKKDYILLPGIDSSLVSVIHQARIQYNKTHNDKLLLRTDFKDLYDNRIGFYITGDPIETRLHPLHEKQLVDTTNDKRYVIDTIQISHYYGKYITIGMREEGSKSHKHITWENISSVEPDTVKKSKSNLKKYKIVDKTYVE